MLHACVQRFDVTENLEKFGNLEPLVSSQLCRPSFDPSVVCTRGKPESTARRSSTARLPIPGVTLGEISR